MIADETPEDMIIIDRMAKALAEADGWSLRDGGLGWYAVAHNGGTGKDGSEFRKEARRYYFMHKAMREVVDPNVVPLARRRK